MHRLIMGVTDPKIDVDHKNGIRTDNRKSNLRLCNRSQNIANSKKRNASTSFSKYKGVCLCRKNNKYRARITLDYKRICLGRFDTELEAAIAYNEAALKYFGEFARINVIE